MSTAARFLALALWLIAAARLRSADSPASPAAESIWAGFVEPDFPFVGSVVDGRGVGEGLPADNLTSRGLVLNLGNQLWACFDLDLLRMALMWEGDAVTPASMAQGSYHTAGRKAPEGEKELPRPRGQVWLASGIYPGIQTGVTVSRVDPRPHVPEPADIGRGSLPENLGRFHSLAIRGNRVQLTYEVSGIRVRETVTSSRIPTGAEIQRHFEIDPHAEQVSIVIGQRSRTHEASVQARIRANLGSLSGVPSLESESAGLIVARIPPATKPIVFDLVISREGPGSPATDPAPARSPTSSDSYRESDRRYWVQEVTTSVVSRSDDVDGYVVETIGLPLTNPWRRNVRLADITFFPDGRAMAVAFDGDVWSIDGLSGNLGKVVWRRFASGLQEPLGIATRGGDLFVHDRNGLWRLHDRDRNGEADEHELVSGGIAQTAETREYAIGLRIAPDGSFIVAQGGQRGSTLGRHGGCVLRISPDGRSISVLGHGFRQPFLGVHPQTGWVTVSDQQGHYIPSTPIHFLDGTDGHHGFVPLVLPKDQHPGPIREPRLWIPHPINASGAGQVWLANARMGPLTDALIHLGYYRPEVFVVRTDPTNPSGGGAVISLTRDLPFAPLAGAVGPVDGQLYVAGFQIWGSTARDTSGLARIRPTGTPTSIPHAVEAYTEGILVRFDIALDAASATDPDNYSVERWNYRRSSEYGSAHYRLDGTKGQDPMRATRVYLSRDSRSVFVGLPDMKPVKQMRVGWGLATATGKSIARNAYLTPGTLRRWNPVADGFDQVEVDLRPRPGAVRTRTSPTDAQEGRRLAELMGCAACHSTDGSTLGKVGPSWLGLWGSSRTFSDGTTTVADGAYVRESILEPTRHVVAGFESSDTGMPSYEGVLSDDQITALTRYLESLRLP